MLLGFDLDKPLPTAQNYQLGNLFGEYFTEHTISLRRGETQTLFVHALTAKQYCEFYLDLVVVTGGGASPTLERVDDNGKPFKVTTGAGVPGGIQFSDFQAIYASGVTMGNVWAEVHPGVFQGGGVMCRVRPWCTLVL